MSASVRDQMPKPSCLSCQLGSPTTTRFTRTRLSDIVHRVSSSQLMQDPDRVRSFGGYNTSWPPFRISLLRTYIFLRSTSSNDYTAESAEVHRSGCKNLPMHQNPESMADPRERYTPIQATNLTGRILKRGARRVHCNLQGRVRRAYGVATSRAVSAAFKKVAYRPSSF